MSTFLSDLHAALERAKKIEAGTTRLLELLSMLDPMENGRRRPEEFPFHLEGQGPEVEEITQLLNDLQDIIRSPG